MLISFTFKFILCPRLPTEEQTFTVPMTAYKEYNEPASSITWTNIPPPQQQKRGPENVQRAGYFPFLYSRAFLSVTYILSFLLLPSFFDCLACHFLYRGKI
jgi:hypothetical protein